jgi:hypothetical protein
MSIEILVCLFLLLAEEALHQFYRRTGLLDTAGSVDPVDSGKERTATRRLALIRWLQLAAMGVLFIAAGDRTNSGFLVCARGQTVAVLAAMQVFRIIGRRITNRWIVLGVLQFQQVILLLTLPLTKTLDSLGGTEPVHSVTLWISGLSGVVAGAILAIAFSFSVTYLLRLWSGEKNSHFDDYPPLVYSESWTRRLTAMALLPVFITLAGLSVLSAARHMLEPALIPAVLVLACLTVALDVFRNRRGFHHPAANILTTISVLIVFIASLTGYTTFSGSWG